MNPKEYIQIQLTMMEIGKKTMQMDIDTFLKWINKAETNGPMIDPTLYRKAQDNLDALKVLAKAVQDVKFAFIGVQKSVERTAKTYLEENETTEHA